MILLWLATVASAAERVTVVLSARTGPDADAVDVALRAAGLRPDDHLDGSVLARSITLAAVTRRTADEDCGGTVDLGAWRTDLDSARKRFAMLQFEPALADLVGLELQAACLTSPPAASDLFRLELAVAEAHRFLAETGDDDGRDFHQGEMDGALARAAVFGNGLVAPADSTPELLAALDTARAQIQRVVAPRVLVAGPGARAGARMNGRPTPVGPFEGVPGPNLVQAAVGGTIVAASMVELSPGRPVLVWLAPGEAALPPDTLARDVDELGQGTPPEDVAARLAAAAWLLEEANGTVVYAGEVGGQLALWRAEDGELRRITTSRTAAPSASTPRPAPARPWVWSFGFDVGGGFAGSPGEGMEDLAGGRAVAGFHARIGFAERWALALATQPDLLWRDLTPVEGEGTLFHTTLPTRVGLRYGTRGDEWSYEGGLDLGVHYFGRFDDVDRISPTLTAAGGVARGFGPHTGLRAELYVGGGLGYLLGGLVVGVEARR